MKRLRKKLIYIIIVDYTTIIMYISCMDNYKSIESLIGIIHRYSHIYLADAVSNLGLHGPGQIRIVLNLAKFREGISQDELAKILIVDKATVSRMIRPLIQNGIVERQSNPADKRAYIIKLTDEAYLKVPEIQKRTRKWTKILSENLSEDEMNSLFSIMEKMKKSAHDYLHNRERGELFNK